MARGLRGLRPACRGCMQGQVACGLCSKVGRARAWRARRPTQNGDFGTPRNRPIDRGAAVAINRFGVGPNHTYMNGAGSTPVLMVAMDCGLPESRPGPGGSTTWEKRMAEKLTRSKGV